MQQMQTRSSSQVRELQTIAEEQFNRANSLATQLNNIKISNNRVCPPLCGITTQLLEIVWFSFPLFDMLICKPL